MTEDEVKKLMQLIEARLMDALLIIDFTTNHINRITKDRGMTEHIHSELSDAYDIIEKIRRELFGEMEKTIDKGKE